LGKEKPQLTHLGARGLGIFPVQVRTFKAKSQLGKTIFRVL
jgi:hypothetical protein